MYSLNSMKMVNIKNLVYIQIKEIGMNNFDDDLYYEESDDDRCYECTGYGDNYYEDPETGELISACDNCPYNDLIDSDERDYYED